MDAKSGVVYKYSFERESLLKLFDLEPFSPILFPFQFNTPQIDEYNEENSGTNTNTNTNTNSNSNTPSTDDKKDTTNAPTNSNSSSSSTTPPTLEDIPANTKNNDIDNGSNNNNNNNSQRGDGPEDHQVLLFKQWHSLMWYNCFTPLAMNNYSLLHIQILHFVIIHMQDTELVAQVSQSPQLKLNHLNPPN